MASRKYFTAETRDETGHVTAMQTKYAMNSAIRATEQQVREHAREVGTYFNGDLPTREGDVYKRGWVGENGEHLIATARRWL